MKKFSKILSVALLVALVLSLGATAAFAGEGGEGDGSGEGGGQQQTQTPAALTNGTIRITPPTGVADDAVNIYKVYKVFDATTNGTAISYTLCAGDSLSAAMTAAGFSVNPQGNVSGPATMTDAAIAAIAAYVTEADLVETITANGPGAVTADNLAAGYYYITTTTGTTVTIDSMKPTADVKDKNTVPQVDKKITGASSVDENGKKALAQVGTVVNYSAEITIGKGAKGYIFHDTMETGLTYNNDAAVTGVEASATTYTVGQSGTDTFTITFADAYIQTLEVGAKITVTYSAKVNTDAITTDPLNNTCYVSYGDGNSTNHTPPSDADVYEAKFTVTKKDGNGQPLSGAGFVIKNADNKYYKTELVNEKPVVSWYTLGTNETLAAAIEAGKVTEYKSDSTGAVPSFKGLANGTYTLEESTVPDGYNKAADSSFTIAEHDYTAGNLEQAKDVTNQAGATLPSTGGIGTTIFYVVGGILVVAAGVLLITKKRMSE